MNHVHAGAIVRTPTAIICITRTRVVDHLNDRGIKYDLSTASAKVAALLCYCHTYNCSRSWYCNNKYSQGHNVHKHLFVLHGSKRRHRITHYCTDEDRAAEFCKLILAAWHRGI